MTRQPMPSRQSAPANLAAGWILLCALCSAAGWVLSALGQLNATGYAAFFAAAAVAGWVGWSRAGTPGLRTPCFSRLRRRFGRPLPLAFLALATLAFLGGAVHPPTNWDALAYRVPRVLHWLDQGQWHWIHTLFQRLNLRGCAFEWMMAPLIVLTGTDRLFFLINFIPFLLFPGMLFMGMRRMGIRPRVAYAWMWLTPSGYCFLLQAGSLGNDFLPTFFMVAAFAWGLRARQQRRHGDLWLSMLAMALTTGVKANNLPLGLLWLIVVAPAWRLPLARPAATLAVSALCLLVSFLPTALLNARYAGDWTGTRSDEMRLAGRGDPAAALAVNLCSLLQQNLSPPLAPFAKQWNQTIAPRLATPAMNQELERGGQDPRTEPVFRMEEMPIEESAGLGLGLWALLLVSTVAARPWRRGRPPRPATHLSRDRLWVSVGALGSAGAFLKISFATTATARLMNSYYPFLMLPLLTFPGHAEVIRRRWWNWAAVGVMAVAAIPLVISPARPILPVRSILARVPQTGPAARLVVRAEKVYAAYAIRSRGLTPLLEHVPAGEKTLGFIGYDALETSVWKPFGSRRIRGVLPQDSGADLRAAGIRYVLADARQFGARFPMSLEQWRAQVNAQPVATLRLALRASDDGAEWVVVKLR